MTNGNIDLSKYGADNVFEFLSRKLALGVGDNSYYLTDKGAYIVTGYPILDGNWKQWALDCGLYDEYNVDPNSPLPNEISLRMQGAYDFFRMDWRKSRGLSVEDLEMLNSLRKQYLAISKYSKNPNDEEAINCIAETYLATEKNCLEYLASLKSEEEWIELRDFQGSQIRAIMTGYNNMNNSFAEWSRQYDDANRAYILNKMSSEFNFYKDKINEIGKKLLPGAVIK